MLQSSIDWTLLKEKKIEYSRPVLGQYKNNIVMKTEFNEKYCTRQERQLVI